MKLALIGYGKMGSAMLGGWQKSNIAESYAIIDPAVKTPPANSFLFSSVEELHNNFNPDCIVFAVKPQLASKLIPEYRIFTKNNCLFISIMAGINITKLSEYLTKDAKIIRAMPNTPASIGRGITVFCGSENINEDNKNTAVSLLSAVGKTIWSDDENIMDAVTAVSGSGPAYVFLLIEAMTDAGINAGLSPDMAAKLARETVIGSAKLVEIEKTTTAKKLRENVTSPNGTTATALDILMDSNNGLPKLMEQAIVAATKRGKKLSQ